MGINRIRLQNGAMGDPRVDARMQKTYQENIAANEAQRQANQRMLAEQQNLISEYVDQPSILGPATQTEKEYADLKDIDQTGMPRAITQDDMDTFNFNPAMATGFDYSGQQAFSWSPGQPAPEGYRVVDMMGDQFLERMYPSKQEVARLPMSLMGPMGLMGPGMMPPLDVPEDPYEGLSGQEYAEKYGIPYALGGRVGFQEGSPLEMAAAKKAAVSDPALDAVRQQLFGKDYITDLGEGKGIAQYYTNFGLPQSLKFTQPVEETTPVVNTTQSVEEGGGSGADDNVNITTPNIKDEPINLDTPLTQMITTPTGDTMTVKEAMTKDNAYSLDETPTFADTGRPDLLDQAGNIQGIGYATDNFPDYVEPTVASYGDTKTGLDDIVEGFDLETGQPETIDTRATKPPSLGFGNAPEEDIYQDRIMDMAKMNQADVIESDANVFDTPEQTNAINKAFNDVKDLGVSGVNKLKDSLLALGGKVKEGFDNTIEIGGKTIDLTKSLVGGALSLASGIPGVGFLLNQVKEDPVDTYNESLFSADNYLDSDIYKVDKNMTDKEYGEYKNRLSSYYGDLKAGNLKGQDPFGKNITSMFGDYEAMAQNIVDKLSAKPYDELSQFDKDRLAFYSDVVKDTPAPQENIGATDTAESIRKQEIKDIQDRLDSEITDDSDLRGTPYGAGQTGVQSGLETTDIDPADDFEVSGDIANVGTAMDLIGPAPTPQDIPDRGRGDTSGSGKISDAQAAANQDAARGRTGGGSSGGGGGKIVCTMMNESYGFGSFRNKIWLRHSKDLAPEYQIGYHKIFLPLVKLSKNNKILKTMLEHIAVHRTIDIRQESRGKVHLLGRVYRKILEPICYWVGKYAK